MPEREAQFISPEEGGKNISREYFAAAKERGGESPEEGKEEEGIFHDIEFARMEKSDGSVEFKASDPSRKIMILESDSAIEPEPGGKYDVKIIKDTRPADQLSGKFMVRIIGEGGVPYIEEEPLIQEGEGKGGLPYPVEADKKKGMVYILETEIPKNPEGGELVPKPEKFKYFTLDRDTLETMEKIAIGVNRREPVLLEGETSTTKTSSIEYMALLTNNEVIRLNLNGQTDTSELIGKFVPNDGKLQIEFEEALSHPESLTEESKNILQAANARGRTLTLIESQKIAKLEGIKISDWRWMDGLDVRAKREGKWLILDEINLAEPQIQERLNSQLEKSPSITLSENGGRVIRELTAEEEKLHDAGKLEGIEPLNPNFRIFATMNPAEYSGRAAMSPAYKDRWTSYKHMRPPTKDSYREMMEFMAYGEQPEITLRGKKYASREGEPPLEKLEKIPNFRKFIVDMAKFQEKIEQLVRSGEIGKEKKEKYTFTRRGLIEFMEYIATTKFYDRHSKKDITLESDPKEIILRGLEYYYLDKISSSSDLKKVTDQMDAIGISRDKWKHDFTRVKKSRESEGGREKVKYSLELGIPTDSPGDKAKMNLLVKLIADVFGIREETFRIFGAEDEKTFIREGEATPEQMKKLQAIKTLNPRYFLKLFSLSPEISAPPSSETGAETEPKKKYSIQISPNAKWRRAVVLIQRLKSCGLKEAKDIFDAHGGTGPNWTKPIEFQEELTEKIFTEAKKMVERYGLGYSVKIFEVSDS